MLISQTNIKSGSGSIQYGRILPALKILILALILSVGAGYVFASAPNSNPPVCDIAIDACNPPVNTGSKDQVKTGGFTAANLFSNGNAWINNSLGIAIPAGTLPTANLDVAGTMKFRGDPIGNPDHVPGPGKVLTYEDETGNVVWGESVASGYAIQSGWKWFDPNGATISSCFSRCTIPVTFTNPFPAGVTPIVTAQPQWITYTNFGDGNISGASTWGVTSVTNTGFVFVYHSTYNNTYGDTGLFWTAMYKPGTNAVVNNFTCESSYSVSGSTRTINWLARFTAATEPGLPIKVTRTDGTFFNFRSTSILGPYLIESSTENTSVHGTITKTFNAVDRNGGKGSATCSITR